MRAHRLVLLLFSFLIVAPPTHVDAQLKKRVAVGRFEDRTGSGYHSLGDGVADMLITALVKSGKFMVVERQEIERVIQEQKFGESFMVTPETAPGLFAIGATGLMVRRNALVMFMCVELMLNAVNLTLVTFSRFTSPAEPLKEAVTGHVFAIFVIAVAAAEAAVALALALAIYRHWAGIEVDRVDRLRG